MTDRQRTTSVTISLTESDAQTLARFMDMLGILDSVGELDSAPSREQALALVFRQGLDRALEDWASGPLVAALRAL